jgi:hypothetical protein
MCGVKQRFRTAASVSTERRNPCRDRWASTARERRYGRGRRWPRERLAECPRVVDVGPADRERNRNAVRVGQHVALRAAPSANGRVGARVVAPLSAFTVALSAGHQVRSRPLFSSYSSTSDGHSRKRPCCLHRAVNRRCTVKPFGNAFYGQPVRRRKRTCASTSRAGRGGLPQRGLIGPGGTSGSNRAQRSPGTSSVGSFVLGTTTSDHNEVAWSGLEICS